MNVISKAEFITSAGRKDQFLSFDKPVIAVCGKSNVGKSSFINMLAGQNKLAKTSNTPGRTRLVNYFDFGGFVLADLPGYGFAQVPKAEKQKWADLMEAFFAETEIDHVFSLLDIRHKPTAEDVQMIQYLYRYTLPFTLIATKSDKLGKSKIKPQIASLAASVGVAPKNIIATSAEDRRGRDEVIAEINAVIELHKDKNELIDAEGDED